MLYAKPALSFAQQVALLQSRGLLIKDAAEAERALARLSYYRLAAYFLSFQTPGDPTHSFRAGTTFEEVVHLYEFDEALRSLVFRATGTIEVALRAQLAYQNARQQATISLPNQVSTPVTTTGAVSLHTWPTELTQQMQALREAIQQAGQPLTSEQVAAHFRRVRPDKVKPLLDTLTALSLVRLTESGYAS